MIATTLVAGAQSETREAAIADSLDPALATAVILEGFANAGGALADERLAGSVNIVRIGAACPCCSGSLIMRVNLNRILRHPPQRLFISLSNPGHLETMRRSLEQAPYDKLLFITKDLHV